ncbi:MAG: DUF2508 family protein [Candidatus Saccharibacteria bacterium]
MSFVDCLKKLLRDLFYSEEENPAMGEWSEDRIVEEAKKEWQTAMKIFEETTDPELIEYAVYNLQAAEKKFQYHINRVRSGKLCANTTASARSFSA